jgi:hypothetical protein
MMPTPTTATTQQIQHQLSPDAPVFIPPPKVKNEKFDIQYALSLSADFLSEYDFRFLSEIVKEWTTFSTLSSVFAHWKSFSKCCTYSVSSQLHVLQFNVRGLGERWEEVLLLLDKYKIDCIILNEVGAFDKQMIKQVFMNYKHFYQKGENAWGGVVILTKPSLSASRIKGETPNVCVIEVKVEKVIRLIGVYAPKSKTWDWNTLSQYITSECCM